MDSLKYIAYNSIQRDNIEYLMDEFSDQLRYISGKCMDIGCGPGDATKNSLLSALNPKAEIIGTDISEHMIEYANRTYVDEKRLEFEVLDIETKNLPEKYVSEFDYIFSFHTLHWIQDARQAFENIYSMLRPDGQMLILFLHSHNTLAAINVMEQDIRFAPYIKKCLTPFYYSAHPRKELKQLLESIGFTVSHCSLRERSFILKNPDDFSRTIATIIPFLNKMPYELRQKYENKFIDENAKRKITYQKHGQTIGLDLHKVLIVSAHKKRITL